MQNFNLFSFGCGRDQKNSEALDAEFSKKQENQTEKPNLNEDPVKNPVPIVMTHQELPIPHQKEEIKVDECLSGGKAERRPKKKQQKHNLQIQKGKTKQVTQSYKYGYNKNFQRFQSELEADGLQVSRMPSDGNCLYHSITDQLKQIYPEYSFTYKYVKREIFRYMKDNEDYYADFIEDGKVDEYIAKMTQDGVWGGIRELKSAAKAFKANLHVYIVHAPSYKINYFEDNSRVIRVAFCTQFHCDSLTKVVNHHTICIEDENTPSDEVVNHHTSCIEDENTPSDKTQTDESEIKLTTMETGEIICENQSSQIYASVSSPGDAIKKAKHIDAAVVQSEKQFTYPKEEDLEVVPCSKGRGNYFFDCLMDQLQGLDSKKYKYNQVKNKMWQFMRQNGIKRETLNKCNKSNCEVYQLGLEIASRSFEVNIVLYQRAAEPVVQINSLENPRTILLRFDDNKYYSLITKKKRHLKQSDVTTEYTVETNNKQTLNKESQPDGYMQHVPPFITIGKTENKIPNYKIFEQQLYPVKWWTDTTAAVPTKFNMGESFKFEDRTYYFAFCWRKECAPAEAEWWTPF